MIKGIIFDLDGVLIDSEPLHVEAANRVLSEYGHRLSQEENKPFEGLRENDYWNALKKKFKIAEDTELLVERKHREMWEILKSSNLKPREGVLDVLKYLKEKGIKMAVASSTPKKQVIYMLEKMGIRNFMETVVGGDEVKRGKPDPEIFLKTARLMGLKPDEIIVIEDSINGVNAAFKAGMEVIRFRPGDPNSANSFFEILEFLKKIL